MLLKSLKIARERYEKKVGKTTKKLLSEEHKRYLEDALKSIYCWLLSSLLEIKNENGEIELLSRLEFLKEMEDWNYYLSMKINNSTFHLFLYHNL